MALKRQIEHQKVLNAQHLSAKHRKSHSKQDDSYITSCRRARSTCNPVTGDSLCHHRKASHNKLLTCRVFLKQEARPCYACT